MTLMRSAEVRWCTEQPGLCLTEMFSALMQPDWIICKKIFPGLLLGAKGGYKRKSTAALAITQARKAQILKLTSAVGDV